MNFKKINKNHDPILLGGKVDGMDTRVKKGEGRTENVINLKEYESLKVAVSSSFDWTPVFNKALTEASKIGGIVLVPVGTFEIYGTILIPENCMLKCSGNAPNNSTLISYKGAVGNYAIKTSNLHQRNELSNFRLELNNRANGILLGELTANLPPNQVPVQFTLSHISISGIGTNYTGITTANASHYTFINVRTGYGTTSGRGCLLTADSYNSGVATFIDCSFGRVDANNIGLEIDGSSNLDAFEFIGCYFGGKLPIRIGVNTVVRNFNISGGHAEGRDEGQTVNIMELHKVIGGNIKGFTFAGFNATNTNAVVFKGAVEKVNILGCEANGITETLFKIDGGSAEDCMLQPPRNTNGGTAVNFSTGFSDRNFKFDTRRFTTENIRVKNLFSVDGLNKEYWAIAPDSTQAHTRGDIVKNLTPSRAKNISEWKCVTTGGAGTGVFMAVGTGYGTTAERPTLTANDSGYSYFDSTLAKMILWNGTTWLV